MKSDVKRRIQILLLALLAISAVRVGYILHERHEQEVAPAKHAPVALDPDYYVTPKKLYPYDLKSARQLTKLPVWVREGYRYTYYPFDLKTHHADFAHEVGQLPPIEKLQIKDVVADQPASGERQLMAVFEKDRKAYAFAIGAVIGNDYKIYSDYMLYIQDPHELYKHWPADVWESVDKHEVKPGMNELQTDFAIGMGMPEGSGDALNQTVNYPNGGHPLSITFRNGKAQEIRPGPQS